MRPEPVVQFRLGRIHRRRHEPGRVTAQIKGDAAVARAQRTATHPHHLAHRNQLVEQPWRVVADARGDHVALDHRGGQSKALELEDDLQQPVHAAGPDSNAVPGRQETSQRVGRHGFDLAAQGGEGAAPQGAEDLGVAVLAALGHLPKLARHHLAARSEPRQGRLDRRGGQPPTLRRIRRDEWDVGARVAAEQGLERVRAGLEEGVGQSDRQAGAYRLYSAEESIDGDGPYPPNDNGSSGLTCA